jgi:hypothetical protein
MVLWFFDSQNFADAKTWGLVFYEQLSRLNGAVPFSVVHDWHANVLGPLAIEVATKRKRNVIAHEALATMHAKALAGEKFSAEEWQPALKAAFFDAYTYTAAADDAATTAYTYTAAADVSMGADDDDAYAYAGTIVYAEMNAGAYTVALKRLADGMAECLGRLPTSWNIQCGTIL